MAKLKKWDILHIPGEQPISITEPHCVDAIAAVIEPKSTNTLVRRLNQIAPLENLGHVKRVKKNSLDGGKVQLSVILCLAHEDEQQLKGIPSDILELVNAYQLSPFIAKVAKYAPSSKEEWKEQCKLWPTSYHPPTYSINGITGFSEEDAQSISDNMKLALELATSGPQVANAAVIVDPSLGEIISSASDQTQHWHIPAIGTSVETNLSEQPDLTIFHQFDTNGAASTKTLLSNGACDGHKRSDSGVSCLHPWKWTDPQLYTGNTHSFHPLRHAALVAIEFAAARDRHLYPGPGDRHLYPGPGNIHDHCFQVDHSSSVTSVPAKKQKIEISQVEDDLVVEASSNGPPLEIERPYLCTGFDIYLVWEPCNMCAMALVHQRIRRIFFAFPNSNFGALGSVQRLQGEKSLNHHYAVFRVILPEEVLDNLPLKWL